MAFPERENSARPGPAHIAYTLAISAVATPTGAQAFTALMVYTTSQPWRHSTLPPGVFVFDQQMAAGLGQGRGFVMDLRRMAAVPITPEWFPRLGEPDHGARGHAPKRQQREYWRIALDLLSRHHEIIERLGPRWPAGRD